MSRFAEINNRQRATTTRGLPAGMIDDMVLECDNYIRDGGGKFGVSAPPLRIRDMKVEATLNLDPNNGAALPADFLQAVYLVSDNDTKHKLTFVNWEEFQRSKATHVDNGTNFWSFFGNQIFTAGVRHQAVRLGYYASLAPLTDTGVESNWVWEQDQGVYAYFVTALVFQRARLEKQGMMWFKEYSEKIVRLNRAYGDAAVLKGARMRYPLAGRLGRRHPHFW